MLLVHRLSDGVHVASADADWPSCVAADPASGIVYACMGTPPCTVAAFRWDGAKLMAEGVVEAADNRCGCFCRLAVMPPTPGRHTSYLVAATGRSGPSTLLVLSLPDRRLFHMHTLDGMKVMGLAADPSGAALAVCTTQHMPSTSCRGRCLACRRCSSVSSQDCETGAYW
jgi:hypothetical protein